MLRRFCRFWGFVLLFLWSSCFLGRPQQAPEPFERVNLHVYYVWGPEEGPGKRAEVWVQPGPEGGYRVFFRSSQGKNTWLPLWDAAYLAPLSATKVRRFLGLLDQVDFFSLPPVLEVSDEGKGEALLLRVQIGSRFHQVVARGKVLPSLTKCLEGLQELTGIELPLPSWHPPLKRRGKKGVVLVADLERSYLLHKRWLEGGDPAPGRLLDLFALQLGTGRREEARKLLEKLRRVPAAAGLIPELSRKLREHSAPNDATGREGPRSRHRGEL